MPFQNQPDYSEQKPADPSKDRDLHSSVERLREFASTWNAGETVDEESGLTADDLETILAHCAATEGWSQPIG